jgi:hypothetical protein
VRHCFAITGYAFFSSIVDPQEEAQLILDFVFKNSSSLPPTIGAIGALVIQWRTAIPREAEFFQATAVWVKRSFIHVEDRKIKTIPPYPAHADAWAAVETEVAN